MNSKILISSVALMGALLVSSESKAAEVACPMCVDFEVGPNGYASATGTHLFYLNPNACGCAPTYESIQSIGLSGNAPCPSQQFKLLADDGTPAWDAMPYFQKISVPSSAPACPAGDTAYGGGGSGGGGGGGAGGSGGSGGGACQASTGQTLGGKLNLDKYKKLAAAYKDFLAEASKKVAAGAGAWQKKSNSELEVSLTGKRMDVCCGNTKKSAYQVSGGVKGASLDYKLEANVPSPIPALTLQVVGELKAAMEFAVPNFTTDPCNSKIAASFDAKFKPSATIKVGPAVSLGFAVGRGTATVGGAVTLPAKLEMESFPPKIKPQPKQLKWELAMALGFEVCALYDAVCTKWEKPIQVEKGYFFR